MQKSKVTTSFIEKFNGLTESYWFYNHTVELRYDPVNHEYLLLKDNEFIPQEGVTSVIHIIDKSNALIPWAAKVVIEKLLKTIPRTKTDVLDVVPEMGYAEFESLALAAKSAHKDHLEDAAEVGHTAHAWIEGNIKERLANEGVTEVGKMVIGGVPLPSDERAASCCMAAIKWMAAHNVRWRHTERKIYSRNHGYAGTMDGLAVVDSCSDPLCCPSPFKDRLSVIDWKSSNYLYLEYLLQTAAYMQAYIEETGENVEDRWIIRLGKTDGAFEAWHAEGLDTYAEDLMAFLDALSLYRAMRELEQRVKEQKDYIKGEKKRAKNEEKEAAKAKARAEKAAKKAEERAAKERAKAEAKEAKAAAKKAKSQNN